MNIDISVLNSQDIVKELRNEVNNKVLENAIKKATVYVQGQAKAKTPVDTGTLRASISMDTKTVGNEVKGRVYTNINYAPYVEFGTGIKGNGTYPYKIENLNLRYRDTPWTYLDKDSNYVHTSGQVAQPFMYPALNENKDEIKRIISNNIKNGG